MSLPISLVRAGYLTPAQISAIKRLMILIAGETNTGKTEFMMSGPPPVGILGLDRNIDGVMNNPKPPASRAEHVGIKLVCALGAGQAEKPAFMTQWAEYYSEYRALLSNADVATVGLDGYGASWEIQRLAEFGALSGTISLKYDGVNAAHRAMIRRAWDSGKVVIASCQVSDVYENELDKEGNPVLTKAGNPKQVKTGEKRVQGFHDRKYLWQIQLTSLVRYKEPKKPGDLIRPEWGVRIEECKPRMELKGQELWGDDCNFAGLVSTVYPNVPLEDWGFE